MYTTGAKYDVMLGIGYGTEEHSERLPIDTLRLLEKADQIRGALDVKKGALVLADLEIDKEKADRRRRLVAWMLKALDAEARWDLVYQTEMPREQVEDVRISERIPEQNREYYKNEAKDVRLILRDGGYKIGWLWDKRDKGIGGEKDFDTEIEDNFPDKFHFLYSDVIGVSLPGKFGNKKCPYLVKEEEVESRLCLANESEMEEELKKIRDKIGKKNKKNEPARDAAFRFAGICLNTGTDKLKKDDLSEVMRRAFLRLNSIKERQC